MGRTEFEFDDGGNRADGVAGSPEGDGDFETDNQPSTGETSAGGQVRPKEDSREGLEGRQKRAKGLRVAG